MWLEDGGGFNFEVAQTSKAAEKLLCTFYVHAYLIFFIIYFCRINRRYNKDVILNTKLLVCLVCPICYSLREKQRMGDTCPKTEKNLGTRLYIYIYTLERTGRLTIVQATYIL